jgi:hypothetical protein
MSMSACFSGDHQLAIRFGDEAYQLFEEIGHSWGLASTLPRLGFAYLGSGKVKAASDLFLRGVNLSQKMDMAPMSLYALAGGACTLLQTEHREAAIDLLGYVMVHPMTPVAFLEHPLGLLDPAVQAALNKKTRLLRKKGTSEPIGEVIERYRTVLS